VRLLAVTAVAPWPVRGGFSLRSAALLEALAVEWDLTVVVATPPAAAVATNPLAGAGRHRLVTVPTAVAMSPVPPRGASAATAMVASAVRALIERDRPDAALLWPGTEFLLFDRAWTVPAVADRIDAATAERLRGLRRSPLTAARAVRYAWYERALVRAATTTVAATLADARWLARLGGRPVETVPNGVTSAPSPCFEAEGPDPTVAFTGTLDYPPNVDAARLLVSRIWPAVRARVPTARLVIAGRRPTAKVGALGRVAGVEVRANVSTMEQVLREAWVAVAPMRSGTGVKNKVLEAWAAGRPVVMTSLAANGLAPAADLADLITDGWPAMAERVVALLEDRDRRHRLGATALAVARTHHRWATSAERISGLLRAAAGQPG
jgi:glycosyltransferase involved in cell wall biosynthesis